jgi:hypothetical protein
MTAVLGASRRYPCHPDRRARFDDLAVVERRCKFCGTRYEVTFESAPAASAMTGRIIWKAVWRPLKVLEVTG